MHNPTHTPTPTDSSLLVDIVELKWLYAAHGVRVHIEQLQRDPEYARQLLDAAAGMPNAALRQVAGRLRGRLSANAG
jgi:hypothetical protein